MSIFDVGMLSKNFVAYSVEVENLLGMQVLRLKANSDSKDS